MSIIYRIGDATLPQGDGTKLIVHCCNDIGAWGAGFVLALSRRWAEPKVEYQKWCNGDLTAKCELIELQPMNLGEIQIVQVEPKLYVCNLIGQHNIGFSIDGRPPIRYTAIKDGLEKVAAVCKANNISVHMPRIGSKLAGGNWTQIEYIIESILVEQGVPVTVYDLENLGDVEYTD